MDKFLGTYAEELTKTMTLISDYSNTIFLGQSVGYKGNSIFNTLKNVPCFKRIEMPVAEELQMGLSIGLALTGYIPITIYPRFDFLLLAMSQLINHLDKMQHFTNDKFQSKVIIRVAVGSTDPFDPGVQHKQDHTEAIKLMVTEINVVELKYKHEILIEYCKALESKKSTILVEYCDKYND